MSDIAAVNKIDSINISTIKHVLSSQKLTDNQKAYFLRKNETEIKSVLKSQLNGSEYQVLMDGRPLQKFKPIKNSFTKRGDKILLAHALNIDTSKINDQINKIKTYTDIVEKYSYLPQDQINAIKTYIYRHGTQDQVIAFLDYELSKTGNILKVLGNTLDYGSGGVADHFSRPVHRMKNSTLISLYNVVDKNLQNAQEKGFISKDEYLLASDWAMKRLYIIQSNSKFINAIKTMNVIP